MEDGYCSAACDYKHLLETNVTEHLEPCHGVRLGDGAHTGKKMEELEEEEEKVENRVEGFAHQPNGQPNLNAKNSVSKYISYTSCRYSCRLCGYCAKTKGKVLTGWVQAATGHKLALLSSDRIPGPVLMLLFYPILNTESCITPNAITPGK